MTEEEIIVIEEIVPENKLLLIQQALDQDQDWPNMITIACELVGLEYTREIGVKVTYELRESLGLTPSGDLDYSKVTNEMIQDEVLEFLPSYPASLIAALMVREDVDFKDRFRSFCVALEYFPSDRFELAVAESLAGDKNAGAKVTGIRRINSNGVTDNTFKSKMTNLWNNRFKQELQPDEDEVDPLE